MKEYPILFSTEMVRAILEGRKTQTRRVIKPQPYFENTHFGTRTHLAWITSSFRTLEEIAQYCPYGQVGDRLWLRETFCQVCYKKDNVKDVCYKEDLDVEHMACKLVKFTPSIHMFRWASRITLEITDIRVQRLQEISLPDIEAEGIDTNNYMPNTYDDPDNLYLAAKDDYKSLWDSINGKTHPWSTNSWVWAISFKEIK